MIRQRVRRRRPRNAGMPLWVHGAVCVAALASAYWAIPPIRRAWLSLKQPAASATGDPLPVRAAHTARGSGRPAYRHSVIPGGAYSAAEVAEARRSDPVVDAHYAVFDAAKVRMMPAPALKSFFVSYRIGSQVYWTRHRLRLAAGEALITDGEHMARARCGNRVSDAPEQPVAFDEPPAADLDVFELAEPPEPDWGLPSALVVDFFPPAPLSLMAQSALAMPGSLTSSQSGSLSQSSYVAGVGMGLGTGSGVGWAGSMYGATAPPVNSPNNRPPGLGPFVPGPGPGPLPPGSYLPLPGPIAFAPFWPNPLGPNPVGPNPLGPNPWLPPAAPPNESSEPTAPNWQDPISGGLGIIPLPGAWPPPGTAETPGVVLPPLVPVLPPPFPVFPPTEPPVQPLPEPGTEMLVAAGVALVIVSKIRRSKIRPRR